MVSDYQRAGECLHIHRILHCGDRGTNQSGRRCSNISGGISIDSSICGGSCSSRNTTSNRRRIINSTGLKWAANVLVVAVKYHIIICSSTSSAGDSHGNNWSSKTTIHTVNRSKNDDNTSSLLMRIWRSTVRNLVKYGQVPKQRTPLCAAAAEGLQYSGFMALQTEARLKLQDLKS